MGVCVNRIGTVQTSLGKLIILAGLYYALLWSAKNYAAARHNFVVNRHRATSLTTFETFVKAASTEDVKQAILLQATSSIFAAQPSGYSAIKGDDDAPLKVIEIARAMTKQAPQP